MNVLLEAQHAMTWYLPAAVDLGGGVLSPQTNPGQSHGGGRGGEAT